ncbi:Presenilin-2 [Phytophthora pseudosyringae]|uniref:Presenilin-2 n=1 Tax=Phytophthora pseudosyringae TaxID=221518 RepID=A0A8T1WHQ9_9STRA|nr:Presenilin-2 [Phytophthora pseudosyringae]
MSAVESQGDGDVRERLLPARSRRASQEEEEERDAFTHEELLHSIGSFSAVVWPVAVTMLLASFVSLNVVDPASAKALAEAYLVYGPEKDKGASTGTKVEDALVNALAIVSFFLVATFVIVCCYKFNFNKMLIGYMMFSSAMLLGMLGGNMLVIVIAKLEIPVDVFTMLFSMYNFSVVGVLSIFYQKGMPMGMTQAYLVVTSVIMAWQLGQFPEWSTWALVIVLAFYDLCAVLTPCGPLKWLVNLVQQEGRPLPGLLYEAEIHRDHSGHTAPPVQENVYYQCESEIPLRLGSPRDAPEASPPSSHTSLTPGQAQLRARLVEFYTKHNPSAITRVDKILERYHGRETELWHDLYQKYITDEGEVDETIKLGLGDFVFYSVLVSRAAKYDFSAMIGCLVSVLMGLGGTLFLLGVYQKALPALPISILLAVMMYFWLRVVFVDFAGSALNLGVPL